MLQKLPTGLGVEPGTSNTRGKRTSYAATYCYCKACALLVQGLCTASANLCTAGARLVHLQRKICVLLAQGLCTASARLVYG